MPLAASPIRGSSAPSEARREESQYFFRKRGSKRPKIPWPESMFTSRRIMTEERSPRLLASRAALARLAHAEHGRAGRAAVQRQGDPHAVAFQPGQKLHGLLVLDPPHVRGGHRAQEEIRRGRGVRLQPRQSGPPAAERRVPGPARNRRGSRCALRLRLHAQLRLSRCARGAGQTRVRGAGSERDAGLSGPHLRRGGRTQHLPARGHRTG